MSNIKVCSYDTGIRMRILKEDKNIEVIFYPEATEDEGMLKIIVDKKKIAQFQKLDMDTLNIIKEVLE